MEIKAIETRYKGYRFRSRLEARWAVFFDVLGVEWEYEPEGYDLGEAGLYLPDFLLKNVSRRGGEPGVWAEIKPQEPTEREEAKMMALVSGTKRDGFILFGSTPMGASESGDGYYEYAYLPGAVEGDVAWDNFMEFMKCKCCGRIKLEYSESNYCTCYACGGDVYLPDRWAAGDDCFAKAEEAAKSARFEHT